MKNYFFILLLAITTYTACSEQSTRPTQSSQVKDIGFIDPRDPYFAFVDFKPSCLNEEIQLNTESKETLLKQLTENETLETILYYVTQETLHPFNSTQILKNRAIKFTNSKNDIVTYGFNAFSHWAEVRFTKNSKIFELALKKYPDADFTLESYPHEEDKKLGIALTLAFCKALKVKTLSHTPGFQEKAKEPVDLLKQYGFKQIDGKLSLDLN